MSATPQNGETVLTVLCDMLLTSAVVGQTLKCCDLQLAKQIGEWERLLLGVTERCIGLDLAYRQVAQSAAMQALNVGS